MYLCVCVFVCSCVCVCMYVLVCVCVCVCVCVLRGDLCSLSVFEGRVEFSRLAHFSRFEFVRLVQFSDGFNTQTHSPEHLGSCRCISVYFVST